MRSRAMEWRDRGLEERRVCGWRGVCSAIECTHAVSQRHAAGTLNPTLPYPAQRFGFAHIDPATLPLDNSPLEVCAGVSWRGGGIEGPGGAALIVPPVTR